MYTIAIYNIIYIQYMQMLGVPVFMKNIWLTM